MQRVITPVKNPDGTLVLINRDGRVFNRAIDVSPPQVWATVDLNERKYYVTMPITLDLIESAPEMVEQRLIDIASKFTFNAPSR